MSRDILISFIGSHDLTAEENGPIEQLINHLKPRKTYLFLTKEYEEIFYQNQNNNLEEHYRSLQTEELEVIKTNIKNPVDPGEIVQKISKKIEEINNYIFENKFKGHLNLTSGTPIIISVLSLFALTGQLNNTKGLYAPNPKYDNEIKENSLDYYKNSFAFKTIKKLINTCDYCAIEIFLTEEKKMFPKLADNKEFKELVSFAKNRSICDFDKAYEIWAKSEYLKEKYKNYNKPKNLYEKSIECLMTAKISERNNDYFQTVLRLGLIRENLSSYLLDEILKSEKLDIIETKKIKKRKKEESVKLLNENNLEKRPKLKEYIENKMKNSEGINKKVDYKREVSSFMEKIILEYFFNEEKIVVYPIQQELDKLEELRMQRNELAHTIKAPNYNKNWMSSIEKIIKYTAQYKKFPESDINIYKTINANLLNILKETINQN